MHYDDTELRRRITTAVQAAFEKDPATTTDIIENLFVQLKPLVFEENRAYTVSQLREMLSGLL